ncbi:hypothetical protein C5U62_29960 [Pseudomonas protegens]|uniref:Uncharacterized protein n=1 Tax=Pseudomonas protegens TaxID=380021 RepID=A0A2T6GD27_9PSED|nr:hypothetical protein [Pseudomonas protegens]PUA42067.1 hypothetical protein C5U62_29960 [Pseudomonas protegens]
MRTLNPLTRSLIEDLTQLLQCSGEDALKTLRVAAPVLIGELQQILDRAVDRRDIQVQVRQVLEDWLCCHPQPEEAREALIDALRRQALIAPAHLLSERPA